MGDVFGGIMDSIFGSGEKTANWGEIDKLMKLQAELNRTNRQGVFGGWNWSQDNEGNWTQTQTVDPKMQVGIDRLMQRASEGVSDPYQRDSRFGDLMNAKLQNQMGRHFQGQGVGPVSPSDQNMAPPPSMAPPPDAMVPPPQATQPPPQQPPPQQPPQQGGPGAGVPADGPSFSPKGVPNREQAQMRLAQMQRMFGS